MAQQVADAAALAAGPFGNAQHPQVDLEGGQAHIQRLRRTLRRVHASSVSTATMAVAVIVHGIHSRSTDCDRRVLCIAPGQHMRSAGLAMTV